MHTYVRVCAVLVHAPERVYFTGEHVMYHCTSMFVYSIEECACKLRAVCELAVERAVLLPACY